MMTRTHAMPSRPTRSRAKGATTVEFIIMAPVVALVGLSALQFALIMQQKNALNYALQEAVREGATGNATASSIESGLAKGLMPIVAPVSPGANYATDVPAALARATATITEAENYVNPASGQPAPYLIWRQISPSQEAFTDFGVNVNGHVQIPNDNLTMRQTTVGSASGQTLLDANQLKIKMTYGVPLSVPLVGTMLSTILQAFQSDPTKQAMLNNNRMPVEFVYTARMQSPAYQGGNSNTINHTQQGGTGSGLGTGTVDPSSNFFNNLPATYGDLSSNTGSGGTGTGTGTGGGTSSTSTGNDGGIDWDGSGNNSGTPPSGSGGDSCTIPSGGSATSNSNSGANSSSSSGGGT